MTAEAKQGTWEDAVAWFCAQPGNAAIVRDAYYDDPLAAAADRYWRSEEWQAARALMGTGPGRALDVGAGRGIASYALARDGFDVVALEPDPSARVGAAAIRALASSEKLSIEVVDTIDDPLPFADESFDVVFARAVLHHIPDLSQAMGEFRRILKPGGKLLAAREHVLSRDEDLAAFLDSHPLHHRYGGENAFRLPVYTDAITRSGLRLDKVIGSLDSPINYGPQSTAALSKAIAGRFVPVPVLSGVAALAIRAPLLGGVLRRLASSIDRRPGRHYSFLASRQH